MTPAPSRLRGLVFDKDGTLFDFHQTWSTWSAGLIARLSDGDPGTARLLAERLGYDLDTLRFLPHSRMIAGTMDDLLDAIGTLIPGWSEADLRRLVMESSATAPQAEATPLSPLLDRLTGAGYVIGLATNDAEMPARAHLDAARITGHFTFVAGYDSGHGAKPGSGMLDAFCAATGLAPADCAMIGDSTHDLASGRSAGMTTVGVLTGLALAEDLAPLADAILPDIGALPDWLGLEQALPPIAPQPVGNGRDGRRRTPPL